MSILVTGGAGYIGSHTVVELLNIGKEIVIADNFCNSKPVVLERIREITGKDFKFYNVDLCDKAALEVVFRSEDISEPSLTYAQPEQASAGGIDKRSDLLIAERLA